MNQEQKKARALKWIKGMNNHSQILEGKPYLDEAWTPVFTQVLTDAPDEIFKMEGFWEMAKVYAWKEIVKHDLGPDPKEALKQLQALLVELGGLPG